MRFKSIKILIKLSFVFAVTVSTQSTQLLFAEPANTTSTQLPIEAKQLVEAKFSLSDFSGKPVEFKDYIKGEPWTVVMFWASNCHVCNVEANQFVKLHTDYQNKNIRVLGVSVDGNARMTEAQEFINIHNINFPNLIGELESVANLYNHYTQENWVGTPTFMVFSPSGKVMAQRPGMLPPELIVKFIESQS